MKVVRHDNKFMQLIFALLVVMREDIDEESRYSFRLQYALLVES